MEIWKITAIFAVLAVFTIGAACAYQDSDTITGTVTVPAVCTVSLNTSTINFGSVSPGTNTGTTNQVVSVTNSGNANTLNTTIDGTQWSDGVTNNFAVGNTEYSISGFTYGAGTTLTGSAVNFGTINAGASQNLFFGVGVPAAQAAAVYTQTITITMNC